MRLSFSARTVRLISALHSATRRLPRPQNCGNWLRWPCGSAVNSLHCPDGSSLQNSHAADRQAEISVKSCLLAAAWWERALLMTDRSSAVVSVSDCVDRQRCNSPYGSSSRCRPWWLSISLGYRVVQDKPVPNNINKLCHNVQAKPDSESNASLKEAQKCHKFSLLYVT